MTKLSYGIFAVFLLFLTSILSFTTPVYSQTVYPTIKPPDSCTGSVDCDDPTLDTIPGVCSCSFNSSYYVTVKCAPLGAPTGTPKIICSQSCQPSTACGPTLGYEGCTGCTSWTDLPQNDCGGSSCGCGERRTSSRWCTTTGAHCYDTCNVDLTCTNECVIVPTPTPTTYDPPGPVDYYGTLQARVVTATAADTTCGTIATSTDYFSGVFVNFTPYIGEEKMFTSSTLSWLNVITSGSTVYGISSTPPGPYTLANVCVSTDGGAYTQSAAGTLSADGVLDFVIAYLPQNGWVQTVSGDVYAASSLISSMPSTISTYFSLAGAMGDAGMVSYGSIYDFSLEPDFGEDQVSDKRWLVQHTNTSINFYEHFTTQMDVAGSALAIDSPLGLAKSALPPCTEQPCVYYADSDLSTDPATTWAIGATEQIVLFVNGNVTINSNITIAAGGFFAVVANGNITLDPAVTELHGIYIASNATGNAVFDSGNGTTQVVITGSVIADNFVLARDLGALNAVGPGEIFMFNPQLLFAMPDAMKETPYIWQEVAP